MAVAAAALINTAPAVAVTMPMGITDSNRLYIEPKRWVPNNAKEFGMSMKRQRRNRK